MSTMRSSLADMPLLVRFVVVGACCAGFVGSVAGLVIGLLTYAPTAVFAVFEGAFLAAVPGGVVGLVIGSLTLAIRRVAHR